MSVASIKRLTPFTPTQISGCQLWFDGADSSILSFSSGSNVSLWGDKSGLGNNLSNASGTTRTTTPGGYPSIFVNGGQMTTISNNTTTGNLSRSLFMITQTVGGTSRFGTGPHFGATPPNTYGHDLNVGGNGIFCPYVYTASDVFFTGANSNMYCLFSDYNSATSTLRGIINFSITDTKSTTLNTTASPWYLGLRPDGVGVSSAYVCEIILYNLSLSTSERQQVEGYLAQKWGLTGSLPPFHPGLKSKIYPSIPQNRIFNLIASSSFSPITVTGCAMWLDGTDPAGTNVKPSNGATVSTWVDKSGTGTNLTAVGTPTYTLSNSSVYVNGGSYLQNTNFNFTTYTLFIVSVQTSGNGPLYTNNTTTGGYSGFFPNFNGSYYLVQADNNWIAAGGSPFANGTTYMYSIQYDSLNNINLWSTGSISPVITGTAGTITRNKFLLGNRNSSGYVDNMTGNIFEVIQYNTTLSTLQRQQIEGYLAWKWGLQANLPANHPYKSAAPTSGSTAPARPIISLPRATIVDPTAKYSAFFNAANNPSLTIPASSSLTLGTNNHTIEFWMYQTSRNQYAASFIYGNTSYFAANNYYMDVGESGIGVGLGNGSGNWAVNINGGAARSLNEWHHYALVRNGTTFTFYVDGTSVGSASSSTNITAQGDVFKIGNHSIYPINGYISNFRLVNGTAVYTSNFTPPTSPLTAIPNTQILLQGLTDRGPNAFTITNNGSVTLSIVSPFA